MQFVISLFVVTFVCVLFENKIKRQPVVFYVLTFLISLCCIVISLTLKDKLPWFVNQYVLGLFTKGSFGTALWYLVMITGAFRSQTKAIRLFMPMRRQLSIMAFYSTIAHNIVYGKYYFVKLFTAFSSLSVWYLLAALASFMMIVIMVPLTVISFVDIRKRMNAKKWKKLQRWAYAFYGLIYVHLMLVNIPLLRTGNTSMIINVCIYTGFFITYLIMRLQKHFNQKNKRTYKSRKVYIPCSSVAVASIMVTLILSCTNVSNNTIQKRTYSDGVYSATSYGYDGNIDVTVKVENGSIVSIDATSHEEDLSYFNNAKNLVINQIISTQGFDVDCLSGATYSSKAIIKATEKALNK